jgi:ribosomal protein L19E
MIATAGTSQPSLSSNAADMPGAQIEPGEGETAGAEEARLPSAQEVAEHVYRLLCQDLRQMRERQGRW